MDLKNGYAGHTRHRPPSLDSTSINVLENVLSHLDLDSFAGVILMGDFNKSYSDFVTQVFMKKDNRKSFWSFVKNKRKSSDTADSFLVDGAKIHDLANIANGFNCLFASFFTEPRSSSCCNTAPVLDVPQLTNLFVTSAQIADEIHKLPPGKALGPDGITTQLLKLASPAIIPALTNFYNHSQYWLYSYSMEMC